MSDPRKISEKQFQSAVRKAALLNGFMFYHTHNSKRSDPGFPDCVMVRGKRLIFAELKTVKGKVTPDQQKWLNSLYKLPDGPQEIYIWWPRDIDDILEILKR